MWTLRRWAFGSAAGESGADESTGAALAAGALAAPGPDVAEARATARLVPAGGVVAEQWDDQPVAARTRNSPLKPLVSERAPGLMGGDEEENTVAPVVRLSPEELVCKRSATFSLPCGAPEGPWATDTDALHEINRWASDHTKPGGSWGVIFLKAKRPVDGCCYCTCVSDCSALSLHLAPVEKLAHARQACHVRFASKL